MKKILALAAAAAALIAFAPAPAQAGTTCKRISSCNHCGQSVFAYYRPVRYVNNCAVYGWVPSYHNHPSVSLNFSFGTSPRYYSSRGCSPAPRTNFGYSTRYYSVPTYSYRSYPTYPGYSLRSFRSCR